MTFKSKNINHYRSANDAEGLCNFEMCVEMKKKW